ncbi:Conserved hypothetical protein [Candidatus Protochlamydia naegleriophila]|uniref:Ras-GEF domain-containing protein n=1 Tax=Candidatus Protochlamydia naegleriophila TaxID=389348 RepID=A0A0U5CQD1_9BACT|nr:RasGEF domain-containing protein [Candidatus Protochlamydia naegleriophila]CUI17068.1 Conserved hypothetical protein [Candidatus Protochlamydia naegleriophila]
MGINFQPNGLHAIGSVEILPQTQGLEQTEVVGKMQGRTISSEFSNPGVQKAQQRASETLGGAAKSSSQVFTASDPSIKMQTENPFQQLSRLAETLKNEKGAVKLQFGGEEFSVKVSRNSFLGKKGKSSETQQAVKQSIQTIKDHLTYANAKEASATLENLRNDKTIQAVLQKNPSLKAEFNRLTQEVKLTGMLSELKTGQMQLLAKTSLNEMLASTKYELHPKLYAKHCPNLKEQAHMFNNVGQEMQKFILEQTTPQQKKQAMELVIKLSEKALKENDFSIAHAIYAGLSDTKQSISEVKNGLSAESKNQLNDLMKTFRSREGLLNRFANAEGTKVPPMSAALGGLYMLNAQVDHTKEQIDLKQKELKALQALEQGPNALNSHIGNLKEKKAEAEHKREAINDSIDLLNRKLEFETDAYQNTKNENYAETIKAFKKEIKDLEKKSMGFSYKISDLTEEIKMAENMQASPPADVQQAINDNKQATEKHEAFKDRTEKKIESTIYAPMTNWLNSIQAMDPTPISSSTQALFKE